MCVQNWRLFLTVPAVSRISSMHCWLSTSTCFRYESSMVGSYFSTKMPCTNCTVSADLPTPPEPSTTILYSRILLVVCSFSAAGPWHCKEGAHFNGRQRRADAIFPALRRVTVSTRSAARMNVESDFLGTMTDASRRRRLPAWVLSPCFKNRRGNN